MSAVYSIFLWRRGFREDNRTSFLLLFAAFALHTVAMAKRGFTLSKCPVNNLFEATIFMEWVIVGACLGAGILPKFRFLGAFAAPIIFAISVFALMPQLDVPGPQPLFKPALGSLHASLILLAYGGFGLASVAGIMYLTQEHDLKFRKIRAVLAMLPPIQRLETVTMRLLGVGMVFLTVGLILGALWLKREKGVFFNSDPKVVWSVFVWIMYAVLLIVRRQVRSGRRFAWGSVGAFGFVALTFWVFNRLSEIHHP